MRIVKPEYADGHEMPRGTFMSALDTCSRTGNRSMAADSCRSNGTVLLPNPRRVSTFMHKNENREDRTVG